MAGFADVRLAVRIGPPLTTVHRPFDAVAPVGPATSPGPSPTDRRPRRATAGRPAVRHGLHRYVTRRPTRPHRPQPELGSRRRQGDVLAVEDVPAGTTVEPGPWDVRVLVAATEAERNP
ncbi:hypothetical protein [Streptomyces broussonetiae]|uniref:hypothetical protein n=1 Tax=Streptomyces broussonetiae TaxID=2686304 RepID=UPI0035E186C3